MLFSPPNKQYPPNPPNNSLDTYTVFCQENMIYFYFNYLMHSILSHTGQLLSFTFFCHVWTDLPYASFKQTLAPPPPLATYISLKKYCDLVSLTHSYHTYKLYIQKKINVCTPQNFDEWNDAKIPLNTQVCLHFQFMHSNIRSESTHI